MMTEGFITQSLSTKHAPRLFFTGVKNGSSWNSHLRIMDAIAFLPSWSPVTIIGYEVKCTHSDFVHDTKWPEYMKLCHQFFWVCPKDLIRKEEIDPQAGLIYCHESGMTITKKRAVYRKIDISTDMLLYLIFWRIETETEDNRHKIIEEMKADRELGREYRGFISKKLRSANQDIKRERQSLQHETNTYRRTLDAIKSLDIGDYELSELIRIAKSIKDIESAQKMIDYQFRYINEIVSYISKYIKPIGKDNPCKTI